jgi:glycosyltransferase involved in cell wall biosynthesis
MANDTRGGVGYVLRKFPVLSETFILTELLALEARGVPLHIFSLQRPNDPRFHEDLPRLKARVSYVPGVADLRRLVRHHRPLVRRNRRRYLKTLIRVAGSRPRLLWSFLQAGYVANEVRRLKLRRLHAHFANEPTTVARLASTLGGVPFSFTAHATDIFKTTVNPRGLARELSAADFVVTVSDFNKDYLTRAARTPANIVRLYNGIDLDRFAPNGMPPLNPFRIVCVARLVEKKGLPVLIEACRLLRDRGVEFRCDIVGKGMMRSQLEALIKRDRLKGIVRLVGPQTQLEVVERYHASHLYVLPAIVGSDGNREGLPVSIVEALASGLPVVTTPVTGIPEAVKHGHNGLLVPPSDAPALADAVGAVISDRALHEHLRANARSSIAAAFDVRKTADTLQELLMAGAA